MQSQSICEMMCMGFDVDVFSFRLSSFCRIIFECICNVACCERTDNMKQIQYATERERDRKEKMDKSHNKSLNSNKTIKMEMPKNHNNNIHISFALESFYGLDFFLVGFALRPFISCILVCFVVLLYLKYQPFCSCQTVSGLLTIES